jgi:hypothetical protein
MADMGGFGSGNCWQKGKTTTNRMLTLDIRRLQRYGLFRTTCGLTLEGWREGKAFPVAVQAWDDFVSLKHSIPGMGGREKESTYLVALEWTSCNFGGRRPWFVCPASGCERRVAILYAGLTFTCRHCQNLVYACQRENGVWRAHRRAGKLENRLGWRDGAYDKPKGMHWRTFDRLKAQHKYFADTAWVGMMAEAERLAKELG